MLRRKAYEKLLDWKAAQDHKALCVIGARQIGKTTIIREFAEKNYDCFAEINFITDPAACKIFEESMDADTIITNLTAYIRKPLKQGRTLVFFDEVQECPAVRTAIKFLAEDGRFDYIESGSMLGVKYKEIRSYPVGFEEIYYMYPMTFEEFLWANDVQPSTIETLQSCLLERRPVTETMHSVLTKLFQTYIIVGGMPQAVQTYVNTHDIGRVVEIQRAILEQYRLDISRYAEGSEKIKSRAIFDSIPAQLDDKNRRFILRQIDENGRQLRYADSFKWLADAGVALPCYNVNSPQAPLQLNEKHNLFKLFMGDTGLLCAASMENIQFEILNGNLEVNMGSILENVMAQSVKANGFSLRYFDSKKYGELDLVIQNGSKVDLLEIKSGKDYKRHRALDKVRKVREWNTGQSYVFCRSNIKEENGILYLPWYAVIFYKPAQIPKGLIHQVDLRGL